MDINITNHTLSEASAFFNLNLYRDGEIVEDRNMFVGVGDLGVFIQNIVRHHYALSATYDTKGNELRYDIEDFFERTERNTFFFEIPSDNPHKDTLFSNNLFLTNAASYSTILKSFGERIYPVFVHPDFHMVVGLAFTTGQNNETYFIIKITRDNEGSIDTYMSIPLNIKEFFLFQ